MSNLIPLMSEPETRSTQQTILAVILLSIIGLVIVGFVATQRLSSWDFRNNLWGPTHLLVQGKSPYLIEQLFHGSNSVWLPMSVGTFFALGWLPEWLATNLWFIANLVIILPIIWLSSHQERPALLLVIPALFMSYLFPPTISLAVLGQISLLTAFLLILAARYLKRGNVLLIGLLLALVLTKPQLIILPLSGLIYAFYRQHDRRTALYLLLSIMGWGMVMTLPLWIAHPNWIEGFITAMSRNYNWAHPSTLTMLNLHVPGVALFGWGILLLLVFAGNLRIWQRLSPTKAISWSMALNTLVTPYVWSWDFVLLLPLIIQTLFTVNSRIARGWVLVGYLIGWGYAVSIRLNTSGDDLLFWWLPWYTMLYIVGAVWLDRKFVKPDQDEEI